MSEPATDDIDDEIIIALSDYFDGGLPADKKLEIELKIKTDPKWKAAHDEMLDTKDPSALSGLQKARAPATFDKDVTGTIHKRSAGRLFRPFGDRSIIPILVLAMIMLVVLAYILWTSQTGSLKVHKDAPAKEPGSAVIDKP